MFTHKEITDKLLKGPVKVTFTKVDGSIREMICAKYESEREIIGPNKEIVTVWDAMAQGIRCFKVNSVISIEEIKDVE